MALKCSSLILLLAASTNAGPLYYQNGPNVLGHPFFYQPQEPVQSQYMRQFYSQQGGPYRQQGPYQGQQMLYSQPQPIPYQSQQPQQYQQARQLANQPLQYNPVQPVQSVDEPEVIPEPEPEAKDIALEAAATIEAEDVALKPENIETEDVALKPKIIETDDLAPKPEIIDPEDVVLKSEDIVGNEVILLESVDYSESDDDVVKPGDVVGSEAISLRAEDNVEIDLDVVLRSEGREIEVVPMEIEDIYENENADRISKDIVGLSEEISARQSYRPQASRPVSAYNPATTNIYNSYKPMKQSYKPATNNRHSSYKPYQNQNLINSVIKSAPSNAHLIRARDNFGNSLTSKLVDNYTLIRDESLIVDSFSCDDKIYGYYGDVANDCQIFHICLPLGKLPWPKNKDGSTPEVPNTVYHFSFICPKYTAFTQDAMVCAWEKEAVQCSLTESLYKNNELFFQEVEKIVEKTPVAVASTLRG